MDLRGTAVALALAVPAAAVAVWAGLPAGALLGATAAVAAAALRGLGPTVPDPLRNAAFAVIGLSLGAGIGSDILSDIARWPVSLLGLVLTVVAIMAVTGRLLVRGFGFAPGTAALSTSPGALSWAVALAAEGRGDVRAVVTLQSLRLLLVTLCLPPAIAAIAGIDAPVAMPGGDVRIAPAVAGALLAAAMAAGWAFERIRLPAPFLLSGLAASGLAHALGWVQGGLPGALVFAGFAVTGAVIGARFSRIARADIARLALAGTAATAVAAGLSAAGAGATAVLTGVPFAQVWVAYAPGGVEGMAAIGLALGYDPAFVATHHILRILLVIALLPLALRLVGHK